MLEPHARTLLVDALRPPEGFVLDCGIGTTYSLDLLALLTAPLAFTMFDTSGDGDRPKANTLEVLESLRRYADRLTGSRWLIQGDAVHLQGNLDI